MSLSLDIDEPQVAAYYPDAEAFGWHHRILVRRIEGSQWAWLTPTGDLQLQELSEVRLVPLGRRDGSGRSAPGPDATEVRPRSAR